MHHCVVLRFGVGVAPVAAQEGRASVSAGEDGGHHGGLGAVGLRAGHLEA